MTSIWFPNNKYPPNTKNYLPCFVLGGGFSIRRKGLSWLGSLLKGKWNLDNFGNFGCWTNHRVCWVPNFDLHFSIIDLEWRLHSCELDVTMQGHHLLPVIWSVIYLILLFGSVEVFRSCGFAGSPLDGSNMSKHVQTVRTIFLFWWLQINPDG